MHSGLPVLMLLASVASANPMFDRRASGVTVNWGPIVGFYATTSEIVSTTSTMYPGKMPQDQKGYMFNWIGISPESGDLIQSVVGSYPKGESECEGQTDADTAWCVSSEVYGENDQGETEQFVGTMTTADGNYTNGIVFNYTLVDQDTYLWEQTMTDAVTGTLLSTYQRKSSAMALWNTAVELQPNGASTPTSLQENQYYMDTYIVLKAADEKYGDNIFSEYGGLYTKPTTSDGGKTVRAITSLLLFWVSARGIGS